MKQARAHLDPECRANIFPRKIIKEVKTILKLISKNSAYWRHNFIKKIVLTLISGADCSFRRDASIQLIFRSRRSFFFGKVMTPVTSQHGAPNPVHLISPVFKEVNYR